MSQLVVNGVGVGWLSINTWTDFFLFLLRILQKTCRTEGRNLRRSLDEAIHRLQTTQEDVIDRSLIKNMILDWFSRKGKGRQEVLLIMSSLLHFTEDEKEKVGMGEHSGAFHKVAGAVAAPLPRSAIDPDKLEGDNVREKWVNFLMAETGDDE
jgi:hypothetical protein